MNVLSKPCRNIFENVFARTMHGHIKVAAIFLVILSQCYKTFMKPCRNLATIFNAMWARPT